MSIFSSSKVTSATGTLISPTSVVTLRIAVQHLWISPSISSLCILEPTLSSIFLSSSACALRYSSLAFKTSASSHASFKAESNSPSVEGRPSSRLILSPNKEGKCWSADPSKTVVVKMNSSSSYSASQPKSKKSSSSSRSMAITLSKSVDAC